MVHTYKNKEISGLGIRLTASPELHSMDNPVSEDPLLKRLGLWSHFITPHVSAFLLCYVTLRQGQAMLPVNSLRMASPGLLCAEVTGKQHHIRV